MLQIVKVATSHTALATQIEVSSTAYAFVLTIGKGFFGRAGFAILEFTHLETIGDGAEISISQTPIVGGREVGLGYLNGRCSSGYAGGGE